MASHLMVVLSNAKPGQEDEFNRWYSQVHVLDTINKLDGFLSAQRFELLHNGLIGQKIACVCLTHTSKGTSQIRHPWPPVKVS